MSRRSAWGGGRGARASWGVLLALVVGCGGGEGGPGRVEVARLELEPAEMEILRGQRARLQVKAWDARGREMDAPELDWSSSNLEVASVGEKGEVAALGIGEAEIEARAGSVRATAAVRVREARLERLVIEPREPKVVEGRSIQLQAIAYDELDEPHSDLEVTWESSAPLYASVDEKGRVSGLRMNESATITARHGELKDSVEVRVLAPVFLLDLQPASMTLLEGQRGSFTVKLLDANLEEMEPRAMAWSSEDEEVVRVDEEGEVEAVGVGETRIFAETEEKSSWARVEVRPRAKELELLLDPLDIRVGGQVPLRALARDARGAIVEPIDLQWSVGDASVAQILGRAVVEGLAPGTTTVTARNDEHGIEASATLRVREGARFHLSGPPGPVWTAGDSFQLSLEVETAGGERIAARAPVWFSEDESVATIDQEGRVELVGVGQATVGVRAEGFTRALDFPVAVRFVEMALGQQSTCGLAANGTVWCWGRKAELEGESLEFIPSWIPEEVGKKIVAIRHGGGACEQLSTEEPVCDITYGLREDGGLVAFHLGLPAKEIASTDFSYFDAVGGEICGIDALGELHCLGQSLEAPGPIDALLLHPLGSCLLGGGSLDCEGEGPLAVDLSAWNFSPMGPFPLSVSSGHGCALTAGGEAVCWGENEDGQVLPTSQAPALSPTVVADEVRSVAVAEKVSLFLQEGGRAIVQGMGRFPHPRGLPDVVLDMYVEEFDWAGSARAIFAGPGGHRCLLLESGRPFCWGSNEMGQAGHRPLKEPCADYVMPVGEPISPHPESAFRAARCEADFPFQPCLLASTLGPAPPCCPEPDDDAC